MNKPSPPPAHGGHIAGIARERGIAAAEMIDLSTGISPFAYPLPKFPRELLARMPYPSEALLHAAAHYYGASPQSLLAVAGSQQAIELLPRLVPSGKVLLPAVGYEEHDYRWRGAGHSPCYYRHHGREHIAALIERHRPAALVLIHPNNPTGEYVAREDLRYWAERLMPGAVLVVDEAFIDPTPERSLVDLLSLPGLVILRSFGKFFGLPGLRLGFVLAGPERLAQLRAALGPWPVNAVAQWAGEIALADRLWQQRQRRRLKETALALERSIVPALGEVATQRRATPLFVSMQLPRHIAEALHSALLDEALVIRHYRSNEQASWLRFGLPADPAVMGKTTDALATALAALPAKQAGGQ